LTPVLRTAADAAQAEHPLVLRDPLENLTRVEFSLQLAALLKTR